MELKCKYTFFLAVTKLRLSYFSTDTTTASKSAG